MIRRKNPKASGIGGQPLGDAVFHGKVGDLKAGDLAVFFLKPGFTGEISVQGLFGPVQMREVALIAGTDLQLFLIDAAEQQNGIMSGFFPQVAIEPAKKRADIMIPGPVQVIGELAQTGQLSRQGGDHFKSA